MNSYSVGLDAKERITASPRTCLMRISPIIEFSTPQLGGIGT